MKVGDTHYRSIWFDGETARVKIIDQRWLPHEFRVVELDSLGEFATAIRDMWVRGAPLIGATAAYGVAIEMQRNLPTPHSTMPGSGCTPPGRPRSTCAGRSMKCARSSGASSRKRTSDRRLPQGPGDLRRGCRDQPHDRRARPGNRPEDRATKKPGMPVNILTHCNAGWLATVDWGTATSPMYHARGRAFPSMSGSTRPARATRAHS
jgi:methylthioribose-1-phosphate isomerase